MKLYNAAPVYGVMRKSATALVLALVVASGCSSGSGPSQWLGLGRSSGNQEGFFYAAVDGLTVRDAAKSSANVVTRLSLHQKVKRSKVRDGYALVEVTGSSLAGWVDNSKLLWKLPGGAAAEATSPVPGATTSENSPAAVEETPASAEQTLVPSTEPSKSQPETPKPPASKSRSGASVFDPY